MITDMRKEAIAALAELCSLASEVRLGQLFAHLGFLGEAHVGKPLAELEDDELLAVIYRHRTELLARVQGESRLNLPPSGDAFSVSGSPTHAP